MIRSLALASVAVVSMSSVALAGPWSFPSGSQPTFDFNSGQNITGSMGDGVSLPNGFAFFPSLSSTSSNINFGSDADTTSVVVNAKPGLRVKRVTASLSGDYAVLGEGLADASAQLRVTNLDTLASLAQNLTFTGIPATSGADVFSGTGLVNLPAGWTNVKIELDSLVNSYAGNGTATIDAKNANIGVETAVVPLPAAVFAAPIAGLIAYRARRKFMGK
jgi:hypothetical protein